MIETIEGQAPAYRDLAYIVFEDLPLAHFGNRLPQLSFEVVRQPPAVSGISLPNLVQGVNIIPASGEFIYATDIINQLHFPGTATPENMNNNDGRADFIVSLDQLEADLPNVRHVTLTVAWFGTDLRCAFCEIRPGIETPDKTTDVGWRAGGVDRKGAYRINQNTQGRPYYGGTPADFCVIQAIRELKARGFGVTLYPFILMDIPPNNSLPNPYGADTQAPFPWRGRISCYPASGYNASPDKSSDIHTQIDTFFGQTQPSDFSISKGEVQFSGPQEWSYRRFILHLAHLGVLAGGVDRFLIGSEMPGMTCLRDDQNTFPVVAALCQLASDVRNIVGQNTELSYAADWSEYSNYRPDDGSGDVYFHLDDLWMDDDIDFIGLDWYPPMGDWRDGDQHLDVEYEAAESLRYLQSNIEGGEYYDWYYASDADRAAQIRTPITDTAYDEDWLFRAKDIRNWWSQAHYNRPGGVRAVSPTKWTAQSKPIYFIEIGCPAVDKGGNTPNIFYDPKSSESRLPLLSSGERDDIIQQAVIGAIISYWDESAGHNPKSDQYNAPMIAQNGVYVWAWDARPFPSFPALGHVWNDSDNWALGHWLNGRIGLAPLADIIADMCARTALEVDVTGLQGLVDGYTIDAQNPLRASLQPLNAAFPFHTLERDGVIHFVSHSHKISHDISIADQTLSSTQIQSSREYGRSLLDKRPFGVRVNFIDIRADFALGSVVDFVGTAIDGQVLSVDLSIAMPADRALEIAARILDQTHIQADSARVDLHPMRLSIEPGDVLRFEDDSQAFRVMDIEDGAVRSLNLTRVEGKISYAPKGLTPPKPNFSIVPARPVFHVIDAPPLALEERDDRPLLAVFSNPWGGQINLSAGPDVANLSRRGVVEQPAVYGVLQNDLTSGPVGRWDRCGYLDVKIGVGLLASASELAVLNGANLACVQSGDEWELLAFTRAELLDDRYYRLSGLLRGLQGTDMAALSGATSGAAFILIDEALARAELADFEFGLDLLWQAQTPDVNVPSVSQNQIILGKYYRPWRPAHFKAEQQADGDIILTWVRRARLGGDRWDITDPPLSEVRECYLVEILDPYKQDIVRTFEVTDTHAVYEATLRASDFPTTTHIQFQVSQISEAWGAGVRTTLKVDLT